MMDINEINEKIINEPENDYYYFLRALSNKSEISRFEGKDDVEKLIRAKMLESAIKDIEKAIELNPADARYFALRGDLYSKQNETEQAISDYSYALQLDKTLDHVYVKLYKLLLKQEKTEEAMQMIHKGIENNQEYYDYYNHLGEFDKKEKRYEQAIDNFEKAVALLENKKDEQKDNFFEEDNILLITTQIGECYFCLEAYEKAYEFFKNINNINSTIFNCLLILGRGDELLKRADANDQALRALIVIMNFYTIIVKNTIDNYDIIDEKKKVLLRTFLGLYIDSKEYLDFYNKFYEFFKNRFDDISFVNLYQLTNIYLQINDTNKAKHILNYCKATDKQSENVILLTKCEILVNEGNYREAEEILNHLDISFDDMTISLKAQMYVSIKKHDMAYDIYKNINLSAIGQEDKKFVIQLKYWCLGDMLANEQISIDDFDSEIKNSDYADIEDLYQQILFDKIFKSNQAIDIFSSLIDRFPENDHYVYHRARKYQELKQYDLAIDDYLKALELNPENIQTKAFLERCFIVSKQFDKARAFYKNQLKANPDDNSILYELAYFTLWNKQYSEGLGYIDKLLHNDPENEKYLNLKGQCHYGLRQYEDAISCFNQIIEKNTRHNVAYIFLSDSYKALEDYDKAIFYTYKSIEIEPENVIYYIRLSELCFKSNQTSLLLEVIHKVKANWINYQSKLKEDFIKADLSTKDLSLSAIFFSILDQCSYKLFIQILEIMFDLKKYQFYTDDYIAYARQLDLMTSDTQERSTEFCTLHQSIYGRELDKLIHHKYLYKTFYDTQDDKIELLNLIMDKIDTENSSLELSNEEYKMLNELYNLFRNISNEFINKVYRKFEEQKEAHEKALIKAKDELMQSFSHKMKNSFPKSVAILENLSATYPETKDDVNSAIKQIQHLEKLAHAINFTFKGNLEDVKYDMENPVNGKSFKQMILSALDNAIENLLDKSGVYSVYIARYMDLAQKKNARSAYQRVTVKDEEALKGFTKAYFAELVLDMEQAGQVIVGNSRHTMIKFSEIIDELVFNALKCTASAEERVIQI
nr:tetratricopeptide repeat protein [Candidatus Cloacimonadota bacterium]